MILWINNNLVEVGANAALEFVSKNLKQADFILDDKYIIKLKCYFCFWMTMSLLKTGFCRAHVLRGSRTNGGHMGQGI